MAKRHLFIVEKNGQRVPYTVEASTKRAAVSSLYQLIASEGFTPGKIFYSGIEKGSVAATDLNVWVLRDHLQGGSQARAGATATSFPAFVEATAKPHLRRCIQAGLCEVRGQAVHLTETGRSALGIR